MTAADVGQLRPGQALELNIFLGHRFTSFKGAARAWTEGRTFYVSEVREWGVVCWTPYTEDLGDTVHRDIHAMDQVPYHAPWASIERILWGVAK